MMNQMEGKDDDKTGILLEPARALAGVQVVNKAYKDMADAFAEWVVRQEGGQKVVSEFAPNGVVLYAKAPEGTSGESESGYA